MSTVIAVPEPAHESPGPTTSDRLDIKRRQKSTWASGNYAAIGVTLQIVGELLCEAIGIKAGERVLDVAAGNGNVTLAAARRNANVTSTDYVSELLDNGHARAAAEGLEVTFQTADAEDLPFPDDSFDVAVSTFGAMFTPDHKRPAQEMMRVVRPGGRIGLANWTPDGFIGRLFKVIGNYVPPPVGLQSPALWGTETHLVSLFGSHALDIGTTRKCFNFRYTSPAHWIKTFRDFYGPMHQVFTSLDPVRQVALERDIVALLESFNVAGPASLVVPSEYLEVVITLE